MAKQRNLGHLPVCDDYLLSVFLREISRQCRFAIIGAQNCNDALKGTSPDHMLRVWSAVQAMLGALANVSKLIWPAYRRGSKDKRFADRGTQLQKILEIEEASPIKSKDLRNAFDHFDAQLEAWAADVPNRPLIDGNVNARSLVAGVPQEHWLRNLETGNMAVTLRGREYLLQPMISEAERLVAVSAREISRLNAKRQAEVPAPIVTILPRGL